MDYIKPTVLRHGTVSTLTATAIKCSPGADSFFGNDTERLYFGTTSDPIWRAGTGDGTLPGFPEIPDGCVETKTLGFPG